MIVFELSSSYGSELFPVCRDAGTSDVGVTFAVHTS